MVWIKEFPQVQVFVDEILTQLDTRILLLKLFKHDCVLDPNQQSILDSHLVIQLFDKRL